MGVWRGVHFSFDMLPSWTYSTCSYPGWKLDTRPEQYYQCFKKLSIYDQSSFAHVSPCIKRTYWYLQSACTVFWERKEKSKLFAKPFVADMPAPYRRGRLKKRNLISSIKKRFTGGRAAATQNAMFFFNFPATPQQQNTLYFYLFKRKPCCCRHPITFIGTGPKREVARLPFQHKWRLSSYK